MVVFIAGNVLIFSPGGYLDYKNLLREKHQVKNQIDEMDLEIHALREKLKDTENPEKMISYFEKEFLIFKDKVKIIKFQDSAPGKSNKNTQKNISLDLLFWQNIYIGAASIALLVITFLAYQKRNTHLSDDEME